MMEETLESGFLKLYVEMYIGKDNIVENDLIGNNETELHNVNVSIEEGEDNYNEDYVLSESKDEESLSFNAANSDIYEEMIIAR